MIIEPMKLKIMRLFTLENYRTAAKIKYFLESQHHAQKRFDKCKEYWSRHMSDVIFNMHDGYYLVFCCDSPFLTVPPPAPVWFYGKRLRPDQIDFLKECDKLFDIRRKAVIGLCNVFSVKMFFCRLDRVMHIFEVRREWATQLVGGGPKKCA